MKRNVLNLASNVVFVKGYFKNLLIDLQNDCWYHIDFKLETETDIENIDNESLNYMLKENMIFEIPKNIRKNLIPLNLEYDSPNIIENAIIDRSLKSEYSIRRAIDFLHQYKVKHIQIRWFDKFLIEDLDIVLEMTELSSVESIDLLLPFDSLYKNILDRKKKFLKISAIIFHSISLDEKPHNFGFKEVIFTPESILSANNCGQISPYFFTRNKGHVLKAMKYNSCLFKKISVDHEGNIKNCPSMNSAIGNITNVINIKESDLQTEFWNISKDEIKVCQDCEFRYVCNDCRAFTDNKDDKFSRPLKCGYNPYISKWETEKGFQSLNECGVIYTENGFSINHEKIAKINALLWSEEEVDAE